MSGPLADSRMKVPSATVNLKKAVSSLSINYCYDPVTRVSGLQGRVDGGRNSAAVDSRAQQHRLWYLTL